MCAEDWKAAARLLAASPSTAPSAGPSAGPSWGSSARLLAAVPEEVRWGLGPPPAKSKGQWLGPPLSREQRQAWHSRLAASSHWPDLLDDLLALWVRGAAPSWEVVCALCSLPGGGHLVAISCVCDCSPRSGRARCMQSIAGFRASVTLCCSLRCLASQSVQQGVYRRRAARILEQDSWLHQGACAGVPWRGAGGLLGHPAVEGRRTGGFHAAAAACAPAGLPTRMPSEHDLRAYMPVMMPAKCLRKRPAHYRAARAWRCVTQRAPLLSRGKDCADEDRF